MTDLQPSALDARFVGSVPELYDRYLGPFLFTPLAKDLADRAIDPHGHSPRILELAAGTGRLTEHLLARFRAGGTIVATDLNEPMLELGRRRVRAPDGGVNVEWRAPVDAQDLPFGDGEFSAVACQLGIMFFPDKPKAAREAFRVLRPGGQWLVNVMGSLDESPLGRIVTGVVGEVVPDPPMFFRLPFSYADPEALMMLADDAGFEDVDVSIVDLVGEAAVGGRRGVGLRVRQPGRDRAARARSRSACGGAGRFRGAVGRVR